MRSRSLLRSALLAVAFAVGASGASAQSITVTKQNGNGANAAGGPNVLVVNGVDLGALIAAISERYPQVRLERSSSVALALPANVFEALLHGRLGFVEDTKAPNAGPGNPITLVPEVQPQGIAALQATTTVPEPASIALVATGLVGIGAALARRRRRGA